MKAMVIRKPGGLDHIEQVKRADPGQPGPGQIRVALHASSLNFHDLLVANGGIPTEDGRILMADGAGLVEAVGQGVTEFAPGDSVVSCFFPGWLAGPPTPEVCSFQSTPGDGADGYACEYVVADALHFTHAPAGWSHAESATITTSGLTAWRALVVDGQLRAGATVLLLGTGGVSIAALQIAKAMGARVIITSSSDEKLQRAKDLGADHTINYRQQADWYKAVLDLTDGHGVEHVIEVGGPGTLPQSIRAVAAGGHIALIGVLTGAEGSIPTRILMSKHARLQGLIVGNRLQQQQYVRALEENNLRPIIDQSFALGDLAQAFEYQQSAQHFGKIVLQW